MNAKLSSALDFVEQAIASQTRDATRASFLQSDFEAHDWSCVFGKVKRQINFSIPFGKGLLTDDKHRELLTSLKHWICLQDYSPVKPAQVYHPNSVKEKVATTLHTIDYLLLHSEKFGLKAHGLKALSRSEVMGMLHRLAEEKDVDEAVYDWTNRLGSFLKSKLASISLQDFYETLVAHPSITSDIPAETDCELGLDESEIILARVFLIRADMYLVNPPNLYSPNTVKLSRHLYRGTLDGFSAKVAPPELCFSSHPSIRREKVGVPCRDFSEKRRSDSSLGSYCSVWMLLRDVPDLNYLRREKTIPDLTPKLIADQFSPSQAGRTRNLPIETAYTQLRSAIEFYLEYGEAIIDSYVNLVRASQSAGKRLYQFASENGIETYLDKKLESLGVVEWAYRYTCSNKSRIARQRHFARLRATPSLWELLQILMAAVFITTGSLSARRLAELLELVAGKCVQERPPTLIFSNRKSGPVGTRQIEARPVPGLVVRMIRSLERMGGSLADPGSQKRKNVFSLPMSLQAGFSIASPTKMYNAIDLFCDYFQTPCDAEGRRYYSRQHQFRRFFAMSFFWNGGVGGMDTLRWFLAHTDVEQLYRYISEITPGNVLRSVKADYAHELLQRGRGEADGLRKLVEKRFGSTRFSLIDSAEVATYIEELLRQGQLTVEPHFLIDKFGKRYDIVLEVVG